jgi:alpha-L-fucosidase
MIVNNHHLSVFPGEDFQTFERDLPGENSGGGFSEDAGIAESLPLETSDIIGRSWGYVANDTINRSSEELIHLLIKSAGLGGNLLLNFGPTPEGTVREAHKERLLAMGEWLKTYGETIYGTRKSLTKPADWGVAVVKGDKIYLHIINPQAVHGQLILDGIKDKPLKVECFETKKELPFDFSAEKNQLSFELTALQTNTIDQVVAITIQN